MTLTRHTSTPDFPPILTWAPVLLGLAVMYIPSFVDLFNGIWSTPEQGHGPMVLLVSLFLLYRQWPAMQVASQRHRPQRLGLADPRRGAALLHPRPFARHPALRDRLADLGVRRFGLLLIGPKALKAQWFPLFFMLFMIPLPGPIVDALTMPMKMAVSYVADHILFAAGYPIARTGVMLQIGQYKLLVADACAGLHTLFTLEAMGLLYLNLVRHDSLFRNVMLAILIIPISFTANVIRVMSLTLITYYWGDEAGQGFLHGFAGMVLFLSALLLIIGVDSLLQATVTFRRKFKAQKS